MTLFSAFGTSYRKKPLLLLPHRLQIPSPQHEAQARALVQRVMLIVILLAKTKARTRTMTTTTNQTTSPPSPQPQTDMAGQQAAARKACGVARSSRLRNKDSGARRGWTMCICTRLGPRGDGRLRRRSLMGRRWMNRRTGNDGLSRRAAFGSVRCHLYALAHGSALRCLEIYTHSTYMYLNIPIHIFLCN